ncbi:MAG: 3-oxoacyl-(acyl-carrier-protein) reductase, partial [Thermoleophilia bacterium]|nr:3-oxoacyl-(acyl-carrier-protein) reductase [Thermoleophilia bacterium]
MTSFTGRCCVVTGASSGIGRTLALALARAGARVYAIGRSNARLDLLVEEVEALEGHIVAVVADLEQDADIERAVGEILAGEDGIDVLVHSAGAIELGAVASATITELDRQYRVNLRAPVALTQALLPGLRRARGQVVFINSSAALRASATNVLYAATKAGLKAFADGLREQVNPDGVRVVSVFAGRTATPMQEVVHDHEGRPYRPELLLQPESVVEVVLETLALPVNAEVTDVSIRP